MQLEVSKEKNYKKKWKYRKRDNGKKPFEIANIETLTNSFDRYMVIIHSQFKNASLK